MRSNAVRLGVALAALGIMANAGAYTFEKLGEPCWIRELGLTAVTQDPDGYYLAWGRYEDATSRYIVGVRVDTGECTWVDVKAFGVSHISMEKGADGNLYIYTGNPAHFLRYDVTKRELIDLGCPATPANYFGPGAMGPDGTFYMGSYPATHLVACDTRTGEIRHLAKIAEDPLQCYIWPVPAVSNDGIVYCPVGLHHRELWSYDTRTGEKKQILPEDHTQLQGCPQVWKAEDGQVYGKSDSLTFLCRPDAVVPMQEVPKAAPAPAKLAGDKIVGSVDSRGRLVLRDAQTGEESRMQTDYEGKALKIYSVGDEYKGRVWGGTLFPSNSYSIDTATGELKDWGQVVRGGCQIYDTIATDFGLLMGSYTGAYMDLWEPDAPLEKGVNPYGFPNNPRQERPPQWCLGPDGCVYSGTTPVKGRLGGALAKLDLREKTIEWFENIVHNQSIQFAAPVAETNELVLSTTIAGGSSARPTEKEALIVIWSIDEKKIVHSCQPMPGTGTYGRLVRARNGLIYGIAQRNGYFAFDPIKRETVFTGELPVTAAYFPQLADRPVGPDGLIYGMGEGAVFAINPADHSAEIVVRNEAIEGVHGFNVMEDGTLYFGAEATLWRVRLLE